MFIPTFGQTPPFLHKITVRDSLSDCMVGRGEKKSMKQKKNMNSCGFVRLGVAKHVRSHCAISEHHVLQSTIKNKNTASLKIVNWCNNNK